MPIKPAVPGSVVAALISMLMPVLAYAQTAKSTDPSVVAVIQGKAITREELDKYSAKDLEQLNLERIQFNANWERNRSQLLERDLSRLLEDKLLAAEAAQSGVSTQQLLDKELSGKVKEPTEADVQAYYENNKQRINQPLLQIGSQIYQFLKTQSYNAAKSAYVDQLKLKYGVTQYLQPPRAVVETAGHPSTGPERAPVTLVEFSDFQCPYCAKLFTTLLDVKKKYGTQIRLVYKNFPLSQIHPYAEKAAEAGLCAADQGHFWEMHDLLFQSQGQLKEDDLKSRAAQLSLNMDAFNSCLASGQNEAKVRQDLIDGARLGINGTPALFINGRLLPGAVPIGDIERVIDEELKSAAQTARPGDPARTR
jgi:protein-disulfide isomerase